jgi:hypothetical protein
MQCSLKNTFLNLEEEKPVMRRSFTSLCISTTDLDLDEEFISEVTMSSVKSIYGKRINLLTPTCSVMTTESQQTVVKSQASDIEQPWRQLEDFVSENQVDRSSYTTVMIRNIPGKYTLDCIRQEVQSTGNKCNFVHLPLSKKMDINLGYAFVNFETPEMAADFLKVFDEHKFAKKPLSSKRAAVDYASMQGFEANVEFYSTRRIAGTKRAPWVQQ